MQRLKEERVEILKPRDSKMQANTGDENNKKIWF